MNGLPLTDSDRLRDTLLKLYSKQLETDQHALRLFSVIYTPISRTHFLACVNRVLPKDATAFNVTSLKAHLDRLVELGLLEQSTGLGPQCHPLLAEVLTREALELNEFDRFVEAIDRTIPIRTGYRGGRQFSNRNELMREVRFGLYRNDAAFVAKQLQDYDNYSYDRTFNFPDLLNTIFNNPFSPEWLSRLSPELSEAVLNSIFSDSVFKLIDTSHVLAWLQENHEIVPGPNTRGDFRRRLLIGQLLMRGQVAAASKIISTLELSGHSLAYWGWVKFLEGDDVQAIDCFERALNSTRKTSGKRKGFFDNIEGLIFILALLREGSNNSLQQAEEYAGQVSKQNGHWLQNSARRLSAVLKLQLGDLSQKDLIANSGIPVFPSANSIEVFILSLCLYWADKDTAKRVLPRILIPLYEFALGSEYNWLAIECLELLSRLQPRYKLATEEMRQDITIATAIDAIKPQESWELSLNALTNFGTTPPVESKTSGGSRRMVWLIAYYGTNSYLLEPREQKISTKGEWSKGRPIAIKRLLKTADFDYLTEQDMRVCTGIESEYMYSRYGGDTEYAFGEDSIANLVGHPLVFWADSPGIGVEIIGGEPALLVQKTADGISIQISPPAEKSQNIVVVKETPTKLKVVRVTPEYRKISELIGKSLEVPTEAQDRVLAAIENIANIVTVHSDIGGGVSNAKMVEAVPQPHVHLLPATVGLKAALLVRPFNQVGPYFQPGLGGVSVIAEVGGERLQTQRSLLAEKQLADAVITACPTLQNWEPENSEWLISDPEACLELILELQELGDSAPGAADARAIIEWPEGEKMRIKQRAGLESFRMRINSQQDWFEASGELQISDDQVLDMRQLMDLLAATPGRFIPLGDGEFLALTATFRKQLDELRTFSQRQGDNLRFHPLAGLAMQDLFADMEDLVADQQWQDQVRRLQELPSLKPKLPTTLQAELRDYQLDGFRWLSQLAHWGVGACLADDMGLGKTLQSLALILNRSKDGPTLILAPTSVCTNWLGEVEKFAPTLRVLQLGATDRQQVLDNLKPRDLLVCSYGLLQQEEVGEMLAQIMWETIVLDEAQSIKNAATKRSQAAMRLQGKFKLLTTGTPIENHLGELWNLFQFINPGLLGSLDNFNQKFANPIERLQEPESRHRLKKLIQPFILRRTKAQVLAELPARTEIVLHVQLSKEEQLFYEALRREALEKLTNSEANAGQKHLQVLAEIMRLRRACCHTKLVKPEINLTSSKLELFGETLTELLDNGHKALVFSQFVDHLSIVRAYLDEQKISYQYLDGSTPAKERKKRVDAFQSGEGDVFLISLKAGGTGLNLTAADYVIHLDPWWNPAVEDQASDRAHRIGQQRPVTIYRLVAKDTIEDKIVALHQHKRDLANSLLEGTEMSGRISTDDLLRLIRDEE
jgi:superfamily II DNA or RNA helicase